jgi:GNAT superfamily N-acetyltransferase
MAPVLRIAQGTGARLLEAAETWALESGVSLIRVSSNVGRERAHAFYMREGYGIIKTSHQFSKRLL